MELLRSADVSGGAKELEPSFRALLDTLPTIAFITDAQGSTLHVPRSRSCNFVLLGSARICLNQIR